MVAKELISNKSAHNHNK